MFGKIIIYAELLLISFSISGCETNENAKEYFKQLELPVFQYSNQSIYNIKVGDTLRIYHSTNSCCFYCVPNKSKLKHLSLIDEKLIVPEHDGCDGCNHTSEMVFIANFSGTDTILEKIERAMLPCSDSLQDLKKIIVHIK